MKNQTFHCAFKLHPHHWVCSMILDREYSRDGSWRHASKRTCKIVQDSAKPEA